jgi:hypothetical protein
MVRGRRPMLLCGPTNNQAFETGIISIAERSRDSAALDFGSKSSEALPPSTRVAPPWPGSRSTCRPGELQLRERGKTVFFSSHVLAEVETVSDRIARRGCR